MFIKTPMKGMPEQLPAKMELREYALRLIKDTYKKFGFMLIETPAIEHIENLTSKQGGENEQLIFKILKRGQKLAEANSLEQMCDSGLRYDLTVPLSRFYANNQDKLPSPFKALQIGSVWRADNPQKGRFRQFTQCDIDIIGEASNLSEIELLSATTETLNALGLGKVKIRINDRKILKEMALACGFPESNLENILIVLDKFDKIGLEGVKASLLAMGLDAESVAKYCKYFGFGVDFASCADFVSRTEFVLSSEVLRNLDQIIEVSKALVGEKAEIVFDPSLVRGMSYYTGPIFEVELAGLNLSVAGGGRYDEMIGKYTGQNVPACGFSIGFERILLILEERGVLVGALQQPKCAILLAKDLSRTKLQKVFELAKQKRSAGEVVAICTRNKNVKFQKTVLQEQGFEQFLEIFEDTNLS